VLPELKLPANWLLGRLRSFWEGVGRDIMFTVEEKKVSVDNNVL